MVLVITNGKWRMKNILANIKEIKKMVLEFINLLMRDNILAILWMVNLKEKLFYKKRIIWIKSLFGKMENKLLNKLNTQVKKILINLANNDLNIIINSKFFFYRIIFKYI